MKVTRTDESKYEIEFDESEVKHLEVIEAISEVAPEDVIRNSVSESLRLGVSGVEDLLDVVTNRRSDDHGN